MFTSYILSNQHTGQAPVAVLPTRTNKMANTNGKVQTMLKLHRFTEYDCDAYAGAENFEDGSAPLIGQIEVVRSVDTDNTEYADIIFAGEGVDIIFEDGESYQAPTGMAALIMHQMMVGASSVFDLTTDLKLWGFELVNGDERMPA